MGGASAPPESFPYRSWLGSLLGFLRRPPGSCCVCAFVAFAGVRAGWGFWSVRFLRRFLVFSPFAAGALPLFVGCSLSSAVPLVRVLVAACSVGGCDN